jgi:signal peptidase I
VSPGSKTGRGTRPGKQRSIPNAIAGGLLSAKTGQKRSKSTTSSIIELVVIIVVALGLALGIQAFVVKPYRIPSGSMEPTLSVGQRVLVDRLGMDFGKPHVGEIAVFHPPVGAQENAGEPKCGPASHVVVDGTAACSQPVPQESSVNFIKRIVAGPGDVISIVEGHVIRNGVREKDSYTRACTEKESKCNFPTPIRVPAGHWFMMGDNRGDSDDSRFWGPVPTSWIIGGAFATYWPPDRIGFL